MGFRKEPFTDGARKDCSHIHCLPPGDVSRRKRKPSQTKQVRKKACVTAELAQGSKQTISKDRWNFAEQDILDTESSATSDRDSTTDKEDLKGWWSLQKQELSRKLWLPTEIDYPDSHLSSSPGSRSRNGNK